MHHCHPIISLTGKRALSGIFLLILTPILWPSLTSAADFTIENSGFESAISNGWSIISSSDAHIEAIRDTTVFHEGNASCRVEAPSTLMPGVWSVLISNAGLATTVGQSYKLTFWAKGQDDQVRVLEPSSSREILAINESICRRATVTGCNTLLLLTCPVTSPQQKSCSASTAPPRRSGSTTSP